MKAFRIITAGALLVASTALHASRVEGISISHFEPLQRLNLQRDGSDVAEETRGSRPFNFVFDALGRTFDLELEPNTALLSAASRSGLRERVGIYRGRIAGEPGTWARIVFVDGVPRGLVWDGKEMLAIEAEDDGLVSSPTAVIYRLADVSIAPGAISCGTARAAAPITTGAALYETAVRELGAAMLNAPGAVEEITLGAVGDYEFTNAMGAGAQAAIITRLNNVDGIFSSEIGVAINLQTVETFTDPADPFSDTNDSGELIVELASYRQGNPQQNQHGLTHLYTGRDLAGTTVGVAYTAALCSNRFAAGLSEGNRGANLDSLIAAHEIGHNFGAPHDGDPNDGCADEPDTFIMASRVNGSNEFSPCSKNLMMIQAASASCIVPLAAVDVAVGAANQGTSVLLGNAINITFEINNNGTAQANNVMADITLPANVSLLATAASQGSCTNGASTVSCSLGAVAGSSGSTVTITATTIDSGPAIFNLTVAADEDADPGNNQGSVAVTIIPAVNLAVNTPSSAQVAIDGTAMVSAALENTSTLDATGVTMTVMLDAGLRAQSASWNLGSCVVTGQQVDCAAPSFPGQSTSTLMLGITGLVAGTQGYTVTMSSIEADVDPADNSVSGTVSVAAADDGGQDEESGVGAFDALLLSLLSGFFVRRRMGGRYPVRRHDRNVGRLRGLW